MALADPAADAPSVPVSWRSRVAPGVVGLVLVATGEPQLPALSHGLRAGRHDVAARRVGPGGASSLWYPAKCGRRLTAPAAPCHDAPPDSGRFPLLVLTWTDGAASSADSATVEYLASHGYVVAAGREITLRDVLTLPFVDTTRTATAQLRLPGVLLVAAAGGRRFTVVTPPGPSDHIRLSAAVTHAFLDAALRADPTSLPDLTRHLTAAGLTVRLTAMSE